MLALLIVAMTTAPAKAQTVRDWIDPLGGGYDDIVNWSGLNVPNTISETANFNIVGTYDVTLSSGVTTVVSDLYVFDGNVTFNASGAASAIYEMDDDALFAGGNLTLSQAPGLGDVTLNVGDRMQVIGFSTVSVLQGSDVTAANLDLAISGSDGTMIVDGVGSSLAVSTLTQLGSGGATGTLTFQNNSTGNSLNGSVNLMSNTSQAGSTGRLNVLSGSALQTDSIFIGQSSSINASQEGTLRVDGVGSTLTMTGASTLTLGDNFNPNVVSDLIVSNSAVMSTGTGAILIQNSGNLDVQTGTFNANGPLTVSNGTITRGSGSDGFNLGSGLTLTALNAAQINFGGAYSIDQGTTFDLQSNADFSTSGSLNIGDSGDGTLLVDGAGSSVTVGADSIWGANGGSANVTFRNGATGELSLTHIALSAAGVATGNLNVESGAVVTANSLTLAAGGGPDASGTITVDGGGSSLAQEGSYTLTVGHASEGTATINVQNGGTFSTGTGGTTVNATGTINIGVVGLGTFNATSDLAIDGGTLTRGLGTNGFNLTPGNTLTAKNGGQVNFGGGYFLDQGTTFDIQSGADFTTTSFLDIGSSSDGTLLVDGAGSSVTTGTATSFWGNSGNTADVTFRNGAIGDLGTINMTSNTTAGTTSILRVESGAAVTTGSLRIADDGGATSSGTITVDGVGSSLTQIVGSDLMLGHAISGTATINVQSGGTFTTGTNLNRIYNTGTVNVSTGGTFNLMGNNLELDGAMNLVGGTLTALDPVITGGPINFVFGTLELNSNQVLDPQRLAELDAESLDSGKTLRVNGVATLLTPLPLAGGTFAAESLVNPVLLDFQSGTFELTSDDLVIGPTGLFGSPLTVATGQAIKVANTTTVESGATLVIESGGAFMAGTLANAGSVVLNGPAATLGGTTLSNNAGGVVRGKGTISAAFNNNADGEIRGESGNTLLFTGTPGANAGLINLQGGTLQFTQALTNAAGGQISGRGTINVGGAGLTNNGHIALSSGISDIFGDVNNDTNSASIGITVSGNADVTFWDDVNNVAGSLFRVSAGSSATFFGTFSGAGISGTGDMYLEADVTPGASPAVAEFGGNVSLGSNAGLVIELGGLAIGSEHDALDVAGLLSLDGLLDVDLIDGFVPEAGNVFDVLDWGTLDGEFAAIDLPPLAGLEWNTSQLYTLGVLGVETGLVGDYNNNGAIDAADYTLWRDALTAGSFLLNDPTPESVDETDFDYWRAHFGETLGSGSGAGAAAVPEPGTLATLFVGSILGLVARRRSSY
jgi:T5SS/PEP-CTERM-associated repeat protein